jgi:hypothetical protein
MFKQIKTGLIPCFYLLYAHTIQGQGTYFNRQYDTLSYSEIAQNVFTSPEGYGFVYTGTDYANTPASVICFKKVSVEGGVINSICTMFDSTYIYGWNSSINGNGEITLVGDIKEYNSLHPKAGIGVFRYNNNGELKSIIKYFNDTINFYSCHFIDQDSSLIIVGQAEYDQQGDMSLVKLDTAGNVVFEKKYGGSLFESAQSILVTPDNGYLLLGWTRSYGAGQRDFYLVKTDSLGSQEWQKTYGSGNDEVGWGITILNDGNYILTGSGGNSNQSWGCIKKISPNGNLIWSKNFSSANHIYNNLHWTVELPDHSLVLEGITYKESEGDAAWMLKTDSLGNVIWQQHYNYSPESDVTYHILATPDNGFLLSGFCVNSASNSSDAWLIKVDSLGCPYPNCTVGIEEETKAVAFNLWPNPAVNELHIELPGSVSSNFVLRDAIGRSIFQKALNEKEYTFDLSTIPAGIYTAEIDIGKEKYFKKLIIAKE